MNDQTNTDMIPTPFLYTARQLSFKSHNIVQ